MTCAVILDIGVGTQEGLEDFVMNWVGKKNREFGWD